MFNKQDAVMALIENDIEDIMCGGIPEYLYSILLQGFAGYGNYMYEELKEELIARGLEHLTGDDDEKI